MKKTILILILINLVLLVGCIDPEKKEVMNKFDGYEWSWPCWSEDIKYILWKENITKIEKQGDYWLIEGVSSRIGDKTKAKSSDEAGRIIIIYDKEKDEITHWTHGMNTEDFESIDSQGIIIYDNGSNHPDFLYC